MLLVKLADRSAQHAHPSLPLTGESEPHRRGNAGHLRDRSRVAWECSPCARSSRDLAFRHLSPEADATIRDPSRRSCRPKMARSSCKIEAEIREELAEPGMYSARVVGRQKISPIPYGARWSASRSRFEQLVRHLRVPDRRWNDPMIVTGCWAPSTRSGATVPERFKDYISTPKQNDYQLTAHDGGRSGTSAGRTADTLRGHGRGGVRRDRRALLLQGSGIGLRACRPITARAKSRRGGCHH